MSSARGQRGIDAGGDGGPVRVARFAAGLGPRPGRASVVHQHAALVFHATGRSRVDQSGRWTVEAGDVLLVPAGQRHRFLEVDRAEVWGLSFCVPCLAAGDAGALLEPFERVRAGSAPVVRVPDERRAFLESLFRELERVTARGAATPAAVAHSLLTLVLHEVGSAARGAGLPSAAAAGVVADSLRFIERNCLRRLTLAEVAEAVGRTPAYVTTALTRATGRSAVAWMTAGRMAEARRLLLHSDARVEAVAERVGYADPTHFIRVFRREHAATPAAWRAARAGAGGPALRAGRRPSPARPRDRS